MCAMCWLAAAKLGAGALVAGGLVYIAATCRKGYAKLCECGKRKKGNS